MQKERGKRTRNTNGLSTKVMQELARSESYKLGGKYDKALEIAEQLLIEDPACLEAAEEVADNLLSLDKYEQAKKAAEHAYKLDEASYIANFVLGFIASEKEEWEKAVMHFQESNSGQPNNPEILRCLGWTLFHSEQQSEGLATLQRALYLRENDPAILCDLAACLLQVNNFPKAIVLLKKAMSLDSDDLRVQELYHVANRLQETYSREGW
jgi:tetratricopeptide (TPR) repeat protein